MSKKLTSLFVITVMIISSIMIMPTAYATDAPVKLDLAADTYVRGGDHADEDLQGINYVYIMTPVGGIKDSTNGSAYGLIEFDLTELTIAPKKAITSAILDFGYVCYDDRNIDFYRVEESIKGKSITWNSTEFGKYWKPENNYIPSDGTPKVSKHFEYGVDKSGSVDLSPLIKNGDTKLTLLMIAPPENDYKQILRMTSMENDMNVTTAETNYNFADGNESNDKNYGAKPTLTVQIGSAIKSATLDMPDEGQALLEPDGSVVLPATQSSTWGLLNSNMGYVLLKVDLCSLTGPVDSSSFTYNVYTNSNTKIYPVYNLPDNWSREEATGKTYIGSNEYFNIISEACSDGMAYIPHVKKEADKNAVSVDITAMVRKAQALGRKSLTLAFDYTPGTGILIGNNYADTQSAGWGYKPAVNAKYNSAPTLDVVLSDASVYGTTCNIDFKMSTYIDDTNINKIKLKESSSGDIVNSASFDFEPESLRLNVSAVNLSVDTDYEIIFESGIEDVYGNKLKADKKVYTFATASSFEIKPIKYVSGIVSLYDQTLEISDYAPGEQITAITEITNNSANSQKAILIIAQYDDNNTLLSVDIDDNGGEAIPANGTPVTFSKNITAMQASGGKIITYIWDTPSTIKPLLEMPAELPQR